MPLSCNRADFKGESALIIKNNEAGACILPERGAKIASFYLKDDNGGSPVEALWQIDSEKYSQSVQYGQEFGAEDGSGFDDMFPNIVPYTSEDEGFAGTSLPDHGEVWSLPWECSERDDALHCRVRGIRLPYTLVRTVRLDGASLMLSYQLENTGSFPFAFQWAAHAIFAVCAGSTISVPQDMDSIINAYEGKRLPRFGERYSFPYPSGPSSGAVDDAFDLRVIPPKNENDCQKYWFSEPLAGGCCGLKNPETGLETRIDFDSAASPYLGIWVNEGGWHNGYNIGIEPSTCLMDDPVTASRFGAASAIEAGGRRTWWLRISLRRLGSVA